MVMVDQLLLTSVIARAFDMEILELIILKLDLFIIHDPVQIFTRV